MREFLPRGGPGDGGAATQHPAARILAQVYGEEFWLCLFQVIELLSELLNFIIFITARIYPLFKNNKVFISNL